MTPEMEDALGERRVLIAGLLRIEFPDHTLRLCDGSGSVVFDGETYTGRDPQFGVLAEVGDLEEQIGDEAPNLELTLYPPSLTAAIDLSNPEMQGSRVSLWVAVVDRDTGLVVPDPELIFTGEVDVTRLRIDRGDRALELDCVSVFERLFADDEGARLSDAFHQSVWPGELGLQNVTGITKSKLWGPGKRPPATIPVTTPMRRANIR